MSALMPFLTLDQASSQVLEWVQQQLADAGFRVVQSFDLQAARHAHSDCPCPHHGTERCNCQMIVLLVYGKNDNPASLVIHGQDDKSWLSLANPMGQRANQHLETAIRRALTLRRSDLSVPEQVAYEARSTG
jgi:hypothetical protein